MEYEPIAILAHSLNARDKQSALEADARFLP